MVVSSYGKNTETSGLVKIIKDLDQDLSGKDVLIVEDILDTGVTLSKLKPMLGLRNPASIRIAAILDKPTRRKADIHADYLGFDGARRVCGGLWAGLRRKIPQSALCGRAETRGLPEITPGGKG